MILSDVSIICANSTRTKAYLQLMCRNQFFVKKCYIMSLEEDKLLKERDNYTPCETITNYFDINEPLLTTLGQNNIEYEILYTQDINDELIYNKLSTASEKYIIYSGFGGQIIKKELFELGMQFIHIHAGVLPSYRGSTTAYYSIIKNKTLGATAIFMSAGIDEGNVILSQSFPMPERADEIDYIYEPFIRAVVLVESVKKYIENNDFPCEEQSDVDCETYYIIHPALKHIAMLVVDENNS